MIPILRDFMHFYGDGFRFVRDFVMYLDFCDSVPKAWRRARANQHKAPMLSADK